MSSRDRIRRQLIIRQAEGYLELGMAQHALDVLDAAKETETAHALYLRGEALRELGRFQDALVPLTEAADRDPANTHVWLALGWCHKRTGRLDLAIEALEEALSVAPEEALLHYNLACYWSLAGNKRQCLLFLSQAIDMEPDYRDLVPGESDFDTVRGDPAFKALLSVIV